MDKAGIYRGRATRRSDGSWAQYGRSSNGTLELIVDLDIQMEEEQVRRSTILYFSQNSRDFSTDRLKALGWKGESISDLDGLDANEVDIEVTVEEFEGRTRNKYTILTGGRLQSRNPMEAEAFAAEFDELVAGPSRSKQPLRDW